jgi:transglutaminase-like putative cysteine protease
VAGGFGLRSLGWIGGRPLPADGRVVSRVRTATAPDAGAAISLEPYQDLRQSYGGPSVSALDPKSTVALRYRPPELSLLFATLRLTGLEANGSLIDEGGSDRLEAYRGAPCDQECLEVEFEVAAPAGILRLPVVTGHLIDIDSVTLDRMPIELFLTGTGEPAVWLTRDTSGQLRYRSAPAPDSTRSQAGAWPKLSAALARQADSLLALPVPDRVDAAIEQVRSRIAYDRSPAVADRHQQESRRGIPLFERSMAIGAGDCDVQNAVLAAMLARSGIQARLAIGYAGAGGRVLPGLHAWVEYQEGEQWRVADVSVGEAAVPGGFEAPHPSAIPSEPSSDPAPVTGSRAAPKPGPDLIAAAAVLGLAGLATTLLVVARRSSRRSLSWEGDADLARLLRGALLRPEAYRDVGSLYSRPLVPLVDGSRVSLTRLRRSVAVGRVYRSEQRSSLALSAAGRGVLVIDAASDEGRVVAGLFGIPDLDRWDGVLEVARSNEVTRLLERALRRRGERWRVLLVSGAPEMVAVLDGRPFGDRRGTRLVVVDRDSRLGRFVEGAGGRLHQAVLLLGDAVVQVAEMAPLPRQRLLVDLARRAVAEETR